MNAKQMRQHKTSVQTKFLENLRARGGAQVTLLLQPDDVKLVKRWQKKYSRHKFSRSAAIRDMIAAASETV